MPTNNHYKFRAPAVECKRYRFTHAVPRNRYVFKSPVGGERERYRFTHVSLRNRYVFKIPNRERDKRRYRFTHAIPRNRYAFRSPAGGSKGRYRFTHISYGEIYREHPLTSLIRPIREAVVTAMPAALESCVCESHSGGELRLLSAHTSYKKLYHENPLISLIWPKHEGYAANHNWGLIRPTYEAFAANIFAKLASLISYTHDALYSNVYATLERPKDVDSVLHSLAKLLEVTVLREAHEAVRDKTSERVVASEAALLREIAATIINEAHGQQAKDIALVLLRRLREAGTTAPESFLTRYSESTVAISLLLSLRRYAQKEADTVEESLLDSFKKDKPGLVSFYRLAELIGEAEIFLNGELELEREKKENPGHEECSGIAAEASTARESFTEHYFESLESTSFEGADFIGEHVFRTDIKAFYRDVRTRFFFKLADEILRVCPNVLSDKEEKPISHIPLTSHLDKVLTDAMKADILQGLAKPDPQTVLTLPGIIAEALIRRLTPGANETVALDRGDPEATAAEPGARELQRNDLPDVHSYINSKLLALYDTRQEMKGVLTDDISVYLAGKASPGEILFAGQGEKAMAQDFAVLLPEEHAWLIDIAEPDTLEPDGVKLLDGTTHRDADAQREILAAVTERWFLIAEIFALKKATDKNISLQSEHELALWSRFWFLYAEAPADKKILPYYDFPYEDEPIEFEGFDDLIPENWNVVHPENFWQRIDHHPIPQGGKLALGEIPLAINIMVDIVNVLILMWHRFCPAFWGWTGTQAVIGIAAEVHKWLVLESSIKTQELKESRPHYERAYRWLRWEAEKVSLMARNDMELRGNYYVEVLLNEMINYMKDHHFDVMPIFTDVDKMDEWRRSFDRDLQKDIEWVLDKVKGIRHKPIAGRERKSNV